MAEVWDSGDFSWTWDAKERDLGLTVEDPKRS